MKPKTAAFTELQEQAMVGEKWRHKKRGTTYEIMADSAALQCATAPAFEQMFEGSAWIVYRSVDTGAVYLRPALEFLDGRFERVAKRPAVEPHALFYDQHLRTTDHLNASNGDLQ